jgi:hypothetical protein
MTDLAQPFSATRAPRRQHAWLAAAAITTLPLLLLLGREMWEAPFPINETIGILQDTGVMADAADSPHSLLDPKLLSFFDPTPRSWYRPLYWVTWYAFWHITHSLDTTLLLFTLLEILTVLLLVIGFLWQARPETVMSYAAATVAVSILVGTPGLRENLEVPLPMTLVGMLFALLVWMLLERQHRWWHGPALIVLTALAVGYKEQGLVLVPVLVVAWWVGAPGVRRGTAVTIVLLTLAYLVLRFSTAGSWRPFEQDVAIGFEAISAADASQQFGAFPYWVYAYNAAATVANILFSEPTGGAFTAVKSALEGDLRPWQINHVLTSTATTALLAWWAVQTWRREASTPWSIEMRLVIALGIAIAASGALGFNYSRDRLGGMAVVFYALGSYYALRQAGLRLSQASRLTMMAAAVPLLLLSAGWQLRAIGTVDSVEARARRTHREWVANRAHEKVGHASQGDWLRILTEMEPQGVTPVTERTPEYERRASRWLGTR